MPNSRNYMLTYYKMPELYDSWLTALSELTHFRYVGGQVENCPKTSRLHLQAYIEFNEKVSMKHIHTVCPGINCQPDWKYKYPNRDIARDYCMKEDTRVLPPIEKGHWQKKGAGNRTDIDRVKESLLEGNSLSHVIWNDCKNYQCMRIAETLRKHQRNKRDRKYPPIVIWIYGSTGSRKSTYVYENMGFEDKDIYEKDPTTKWWDGYEWEKCAMVDDMRKDFMKFAELLRFLGKFPITREYKNGTIDFNSPYIVITTTRHPEDMYGNRAGEDVLQLLRRITKILNSDKGFKDEQDIKEVYARIDKMRLDTNVCESGSMIQDLAQQSCKTPTIGPIAKSSIWH